MQEIAIGSTNPRVQRMQRRAFVRNFLKNMFPFMLLLAVLILIALIADHKAHTINKRVNTVKPLVSVASASATPTVVVKEDKRVAILKAYLSQKQSPLASLSAEFVDTADTYGLDWTLMPAIAGMESNFGKAMPKGSNNPFGLGGTHLMVFPSISAAIHFEGKLLSQSYKLAANRAIGAIYCPKVECNPNWAEIVTRYSNAIVD